MARLWLVSCVSKKQPVPAMARDLYQSPLFRLSRELVERSGDSWYILSAKHGLLHPDTVIEPYERTLGTMSALQRREWGSLVTIQMAHSLPRRLQAIMVLAGLHYRNPLVDTLPRHADRIEIPLQGKRIGEQLSWLRHALDA